MLRRANDLIGFTLGARDGEIGRVRDFYFDETNWTVRYLMADTGKWLPLRQVLIAPVAVRGFKEDRKEVIVDLTKDQVKHSPSIDEHTPLSRKYEMEYFRYFGWPYYWQDAGLWGPATPPVAASGPGPGQEGRIEAADEPVAEPHLRNAEEVLGYHIQAADGEIGHLEDLILDDQEWVFRYLAVDTRNWWPGKRVLLPPMWATSLDWQRSRIHVQLDRVTIRNAPEYDPSAPIDREFEVSLFEYYHRPPYWERRLAA
jgi:hypothetical protein